MSVSSTNRSAALIRLRHQGGDAVVVTEADLGVGQGIVLVDDGHDAELEQPLRSVAGVRALEALEEVERGDQHPGPATRPQGASTSL